jgi:hypothetical protein
MNLQTIPFSSFENKKTYELNTFEELGVKINVLNEISLNGRKLPSGNLYKFGILIDGKYFWYFNGEPVRTIQEQRVDRKKMREIYSVLLEINKNTNNTPFVFKVKK